MRIVDIILRIRTLCLILLTILISIGGTAATNEACFGSGCHSEPGNLFINTTLYDNNSHSPLKCINCHNISTNLSDQDHGKFVLTLNGTKFTPTLFFSNYSSSNYQLCYRCHNETKLIGLPPGYSNNLWTHRSSPSFPLNTGERGTNFANELAAGFNFGNYPANLHWDHLDMIGISYDRMWDSSGAGILNSMTSCTACHEPHGNTSGPALTRDDLGIRPGRDENGEYGQLTNINYISPGGDAYCNGCHGNGSYLKYYRTPKNFMDDCINCHVPSEVNISLFGRHSNINTSDGSGVVSNYDCWTCHYKRDMDRGNVYMCNSCHINSSGVVNVTDPSLIINKLKHALATCKNCHAPDMYHSAGTAGPRGRIENPDWALVFPINGSTGCLDCHSSHNGFDEPFHAPGMYRGTGGHTYNQSLCGTTGCHKDTSNPFSVHYVAGKTPGRTTAINSLTVPASVTRGSPINISLNACYKVASCYAFIQIELAQYRLKNTTTGNITINWTYMSPTDGKFNSSTENAFASIVTNNLNLGNYTLEVRAMSGAPITDPTKPYYPLNGLMSSIVTRYVEVT